MLLEKSLEGGVAMVLLKFLYDAVYVKLPEGFKAIESIIEKEASRNEQRHRDEMNRYVAIEQGISELRREQGYTSPREKRSSSIRPGRKRPRRK